MYTEHMHIFLLRGGGVPELLENGVLTQQVFQDFLHLLFKWFFSMYPGLGHKSILTSSRPGLYNVGSHMI